MKRTVVGVQKNAQSKWYNTDKGSGLMFKISEIYNANKSIIESTAKKYGKKSSSNGHWIYPGCKLTIPPK